LLFAAAVIQPQVVNVAHGGGGGGGFHGRDGEIHDGGFHHRFGHFRAGFGFAGFYSPFWWGYGYPFYPFPDYGYYDNYPDHRYFGYDPGSSYYGNHPDSGYGSQSNARQTWYYCFDPAGYYPSVTHCNTVWQYGPGSAKNRDRAVSAHRSHVGR
jgi:hypothetical protein